MSKAGDFIKKYGMDYRSFDLKELVPIYIEEMERGLDGSGSIPMLPSYLQLKSSIDKNRKIACVDAGGTNLRLCIAWFDDNGDFVMGEIKRMLMPGVERELDAQEYFDTLAELIAPYCEETKEVVISFAYRAKTTPDIDNEILVMTKEVKVTGVEGKHLAKEVKASLQKKGVSGVDMIVINDTVASALSGMADHSKDGYGAFTGTILGTGSNSCYPEKVSNIGKISGFNADCIMLINTEAGSYDKMPRTQLDLDYDASTVFPGIGCAEKMTSGAYLGALSEFVLKRAAEENVFHTRGVMDIARLTSADVSEYLGDGSGIIEEYMIDEEDEQNARELLQNIVLRAGRMAALQMAAMAVKSAKQNTRLCMSVEGTTYEKMPGLKQELHSTLHEYLAHAGLSADIVTVENAVLKGCAIAGLSQ